MAGLSAAPSLSSSSSSSLVQGDRLSHLSEKSAVSLVSKSGSQRLEIIAQKKVAKKRQIILTQDVPGLGNNGQLVSVKIGYFRNYLFPFGKAQVATREYLKELKIEEERKEAEKLKVKEDAESLARLLQSIGVFNVKRKAGKAKKIFGSVTSADLSDIIKAQTSKEIDKKDITLPEIREIGEYIAELKLHPEVVARVKVNVIAL